MHGKSRILLFRKVISMTGIIDVGGGMRDIYGAGVLDYFLDNNITFDVCIGVSAGSANLASFLAKQRGRTYRFYAEFSSRKEYMSYGNMLKTGSFFNLDYIYSDLSDSDGECPLNFEELEKSESQLITVVTNADTGAAEYFTKNDIAKDDLWTIKASCAMPVACKPFIHDGKRYADGGVAAPIPVEKAIEMGCDKVYVIIPRPAVRKNREFSSLMKPFLKDSPKVLELMKRRPEIYNSQLEALERFVKEGKAVIISPDNDKGLNMITTDAKKLTDYYNKGYNDAKKIFAET